jgi:hypothetical protein
MPDTSHAETIETIETLRARIQTLEAENVALRPLVLRIAEARMCRDMATMIESCPYCTLKRGGDFGYGGKHDETCIVTQARLLGF